MKTIKNARRIGCSACRNIQPGQRISDSGHETPLGYEKQSPRRFPVLPSSAPVKQTPPGEEINRFHAESVPRRWPPRETNGRLAPLPVIDVSISRVGSRGEALGRVDARGGCVLRSKVSRPAIPRDHWAAVTSFRETSLVSAIKLLRFFHPSCVPQTFHLESPGSSAHPRAGLRVRRREKPIVLRATDKIAKRLSRVKSRERRVGDEDSRGRELFPRALVRPRRLERAAIEVRDTGPARRDEIINAPGSRWPAAADYNIYGLINGPPTRSRAASP